jgi:E3 ubiquitin-protein ligase HUWE1
LISVIYPKNLRQHNIYFLLFGQIDAFLEGFHTLVPPELVSIFDAQQLELLICGLPDIEIEDLRANSTYQVFRVHYIYKFTFNRSVIQGYKLSDPQIQYFWNVLRGFSKVSTYK